MAWRSFSTLSFRELDLLAGSSWREEKAAGQAGKSQYGDGGRIAASPGHRASDRGKILQMRKSYGPFKSVDDLLAIRGLGAKRLEKMRKYLTAGKAAAPKSTTPSPSPVHLQKSLQTNHKTDFSTQNQRGEEAVSLRPK